MAKTMARMGILIIGGLALLLAGPLWKLAQARSGPQADWRTATSRAAGLAPDAAQHPVIGGFALRIYREADGDLALHVTVLRLLRVLQLCGIGRQRRVAPDKQRRAVNHAPLPLAGGQLRVVDEVSRWPVKQQLLGRMVVALHHHHFLRGRDAVIFPHAYFSALFKHTAFPLGRVHLLGPSRSGKEY